MRRTPSSASAQVGLPAVAPPAGALTVAGHGQPEVERLVGQGLVELVELAVGRAGGRRGEDRRRAAGPGQRHGRGLEQRQVGVAATGVAGDGLEQARAAAWWSSPAPPTTAGWPAAARCGAGRRRARPSASRSGVPTNGKLTTSTKPAPASVRPTRRRSRWLRVRPRPGGGRRQHRRHVGVADDPRDLLDQVEGVGEVGAPRRRRRPSGARRPPSTSQPTARRLATVVVGGSMSMPVTRAGRPASIGRIGSRRVRADHASRRARPCRRRSVVSSSATRSAATSAIVGSVPRSNRLAASDGSLWRRSVRKIGDRRPSARPR